MRKSVLVSTVLIGLSVVLSGCAGTPSTGSAPRESIIEIPRIYKALALPAPSWPLRGGQHWVYQYTRFLRRPRVGAPDTVSHMATGMDTLLVENYLEDDHETRVFMRDPSTRTGDGAEVTWVYSMKDSVVTLPGPEGKEVVILRFPLREGDRFGHDPFEQVSGDLFTWVVMGLEVTSTPAGRYRAWKLNYDTPAFVLSRWFVPGLGIVAEERHPHKGGYDYRAELVRH